MTHENGVSHRDLQPSNVPIPDMSKPCLLPFSSARDPTVVMGSCDELIDASDFLLLDESE